jgi:cobalt-zinc-cadmium efflux system membrane fusion protein
MSLSVVLSGCQGASHEAESVKIGKPIVGRAASAPPSSQERSSPEEGGTASGASEGSLPRLLPVSAETSKRMDLKTEPVETKRLVLPLHLTGHIEPDYGGEVDVSARLDGRLTKICIKPGEHVKKGDILAMLDSREVTELEAEMVEAKSKLDNAQAHAEREREVYEERLARPKELLDEKSKVGLNKVKLDLAQSEFHRIESLYKEKIAAGKDYIAAKAAVAEAKLAMDQSLTDMQREQNLYENRVLMKKDYQLALAEVTREKQHLNTIIRRLAFVGADEKLTAHILATGNIDGLAHIVAPIDGILNRYECAPGEMVQPEKSIFRITNLRYVQVYADLHEIDLQRVKLGDRARIKVPSYPSKHFEAVISLIAQHVNAETRSVPIKAHLANFDGLLKPNMYAELDMEGEPKTCLVCPTAALQDYEGHKIVFVQKANGFEERVVKPGAISSQYFEVLSGLSEGEMVATQGSLMLKTELGYHR